MPLDVFADQQRNALRYATRRPQISMDPGLGGAFEAAYQELVSRAGARHWGARSYEIVQEYLDEYYDATGIELLHPLSSETVRQFSFTELQEGEPWQTASRSYNAWAESVDGQRLFPTVEELDQTILRERQQMLDEARRTLASIQTASSSIGAFLGNVAWYAAEPAIASSALLGSPWAAGVVRTALVEGGIAALTETGLLLATQDFIREVDPEFGFAEAASQVGMAAAGGIVLGGGIKGLARAWNLARGLRAWSQLQRDAGTIVTQEAARVADTTPPIQGDPAVQRAAADRVVEQVAQGGQVQATAEARRNAELRVNRVTTPTGERINVQYEVVPASQLIVSNQPDFSLNPQYPQWLQPRDRARAALQQQVREISARLDPEQLGVSPSAETGAPIVGPDGVVESGNGRVNAILLAYRTNSERADAYQAFLRDQGFDIAGIDEPVLIARRTTAMDQAQRIEFVHAANAERTATLGPTEQALADARLLDAELLSRLTDAGIETAANRDFVRGFVAKLPTGARNELLTQGGQLNAQGLTRLRSALFARAYDDVDLITRVVESQDNNIRTIGGALSDASRAWAIMRDAVARGDIPRGMDITEDLVAAVRVVMEARDRGVPVGSILNQGELLGGPSQTAQLLTRSMFRVGKDGEETLRQSVARSTLANELRVYAEEALKNTSGPRLLGEPLRAEELLARSLEDRPDLANEALTRLADDANVEKLVNDPVVDEAVIAHARVIADETPDLLVDVPTGRVGPDGEEIIEARSVKDALDDAELEIVAAEDIAACARGTIGETT